jgi:uncharacterized membrane protein (DUF373 family)
MRNVFQRSVDGISGLSLPMITFGLVIGVAHLFKTVGFFTAYEELTRDYQGIISEVLTVFILVELIGSIMAYFTSRQLRIRSSSTPRLYASCGKS